MKATPSTTDKKEKKSRLLNEVLALSPAQINQQKWANLDWKYTFLRVYIPVITGHKNLVMGDDEMSTFCTALLDHKGLTNLHDILDTAHSLLYQHCPIKKEEDKDEMPSSIVPMPSSENNLKYHTELYNHYRVLCSIDFNNKVYRSKLNIAQAKLCGTGADRLMTTAENKHYHHLRNNEELCDYATLKYHFQLGIADAHQNLGDNYRAQGQLEEARRHYSKFHQLSKELYKEKPDNNDLKHQLAEAYTAIGIYPDIEKDLNKASGYTFTGHRLLKELHEVFPEHTIYSYHLIKSHEALGDLSQRRRNLDIALEHYSKAYQQAETLQQKYPEIRGLKHYLSIANERLADILLRKGDKNKALCQYQEAYNINKKLHEHQPDDDLYTLGYALICMKLGEVFIKMKNTKEAKVYLQEYLSLSKKLFSNLPENSERARNLAQAYLRTVPISFLLHMYRDATQHLAMAVVTQHALYEHTGNCEDKTLRDVMFEALQTLK